MPLLIALLPTLPLTATLIPTKVGRGVDTAIAERDAAEAELCPSSCLSNYETFFEEHHDTERFDWLVKTLCLGDWGTEVSALQTSAILSCTETTYPSVAVASFAHQLKMILLPLKRVKPIFLPVASTPERTTCPGVCPGLGNLALRPPPARPQQARLVLARPRPPPPPARPAPLPLHLRLQERPGFTFRRNA